MNVLLSRITTILLLAFSAVVYSTNTLALSSDRDQPANIEADDIEFDFRKGTRTYTANVLVVQGTLRLKADKLVGIYEDGELANATAWGSLARFKQRPDGKQHDVEGWAKKIVVDQKNNTLTLIGKAALKQGSDTARGETIVYNMANDTLRVRGGSAGGAKIGAGGKSGADKPERTIEDPFKDDAQGPPPVTKAAKPKKSKDTAGDKVEPEPSADEDEPAAKPTRSGRSRLIINPK
ncbi:MAG: lipopolysaccharide transport periplasmic protein LptA [Gammaproteobacteria bacterium]|nr:lipopolysaccharide transport periplasmic protein LptA [Gammaproteobacteria bacterium]